jgi:aminopeptidase N
MRVIAHELGHQMFGNVVTCKWWDETWLNEGFATVFEFLLVDNIYREHKFPDFFNIIRLQSAFQTDALDNTHPMTFEGNRNTRIVYDKCMFFSNLIINFVY